MGSGGWFGCGRKLVPSTGYIGNDNVLFLSTAMHLIITLAFTRYTFVHQNLR